MDLSEKMNELKTTEEKLGFVSQALQATSDVMKEICEENQVLTSRLEKAAAYFQESKEDVKLAEKRVTSIMARNLQKTRDEIYTIGNALHDYALALSEKSTAKLTLIEVNNLQYYLNEIILNLQENGLWDQDVDVKPVLDQVEKVKAPRKPRKKKTDSSEEVNTEQPEG